MELAKRVSQCKAIFFDLFHTLYSFKTDNAGGASTSEILGIPEDAWNNLLFDSSDERLRGLENDRYAIIRKLAHMHDPTIEEEVIREAADARIDRFSSGLKEVKQERLVALAELKSRGKSLGLISNADSVEVSGWSESPLAQHFDSAIFSYATGFVKAGT